MSDIKIGKFQIVGTLGSGAHSSLLHIRRSADSKSYALKVVPLNEPEDQKYLEQAEHEYRVGQMLDHPSLVKVHSLELVRDWLFRVKKAHLLIEFVNGKTLDTCPRIPIPQMVQVFKAIADALVHMHRRNVYHADIKPNNVMLAKGGTVKVIDYGLAWIRGENKDRVQGTPEYMAPEQAAKKAVNDRTEIYNLGATMYRMMTWRVPPSVLTEDGPIDPKVFAKLLKPVNELAPTTPKRLAELIQRCMIFDPAKRPERMSEVQASLEELVGRLVQGPEDELEGFEWE